MMKYASWIVAAVLAFTAVAGRAQEKTVVVNMVDLVRFHPNRERDRKLMHETEKDYQAKLDKQRDRVEALQADYEKAVKEAHNPALNETARAAAESQVIKHRDVLADADRDLRQEIQKLQRALSDLDSRLLRQITSEIREVITAYAKEKNLSLVLDGSVMAYFDEKLDVTDDILKRMGIDPKKRHEAKQKEKEKEKEKPEVEKE